MRTWTLVIWVLSSQPIPLQGFTSQEACEQAAKTVMVWVEARDNPAPSTPPRPVPAVKKQTRVRPDLWLCVEVK